MKVLTVLFASCSAWSSNNHYWMGDFDQGEETTTTPSETTTTQMPTLACYACYYTWNSENGTTHAATDVVDK